MYCFHRLRVTRPALPLVGERRGPARGPDEPQAQTATANVATNKALAESTRSNPGSGDTLMPREPIDHTEYFDQVCKALGDWGALVLSLDAGDKPNPMTIGWGSLGTVWGRPMWVVLIRPSRYTYACIEQTGDFTVNVPPAALAEVAMFCGTVSGRDHDKVAEKGLTVEPSTTIQSPGIVECPIIYECKVVQKTDVVPEAFDPQIVQQCYPQGDFHRVYFGQILRTTADREAVEGLLG